MCGLLYSVLSLLLLMTEFYILWLIDIPLYMWTKFQKPFIIWLKLNLFPSLAYCAPCYNKHRSTDFSLTYCLHFLGIKSSSWTDGSHSNSIFNFYTLYTVFPNDYWFTFLSAESKDVILFTSLPTVFVTLMISILDWHISLWFWFVFPWLLLLLSIISSTYWTYVYLLLWNFYYCFVLLLLDF